nr:MerR family transcriptional regulator [Brachybacterium saurashtrense]
MPVGRSDHDRDPPGGARPGRSLPRRRDGEPRVRIGELAARTGVSPRSLRYYEQHGLLDPERIASGQRVYTAVHESTVRRIQELFGAGFCSAVIQELLPAMSVPDPDAALLAPPTRTGLRRRGHGPRPRALADHRLPAQTAPAQGSPESRCQAARDAARRSRIGASAGSAATSCLSPGSVRSAYSSSRRTGARCRISLCSPSEAMRARST